MDVADVGADVLVLLEEALEVDDEILHDGEVGEGADLGDLGVGVGDAGERVDTIDIHGAAAADAFAARGAEREGGVLVGLDGGEKVEDHEVLRLDELVRVDALGVVGGIEAHDLQEREVVVLGGLDGGGRARGDLLTGNRGHLDLVHADTAEHFVFLFFFLFYTKKNNTDTRKKKKKKYMRAM